MTTIQERENLIPEKSPSRTGFTSRPVCRLATRRKPRTLLDIECSHLVRGCADSIQSSTHGHLPVNYRLWLEAGKHQPPFPERPDSSYNSNVWRNFRQHYGFSLKSEGRKVDELIASMYPMNIPGPSKVGEYTYAKFVKETPLIGDERYKKMVIDRSVKDVQEFKRLRLRTEMRDPPLSESGNILPPRDFKKYAHRFIPPDDYTPRSPTPEPEGPDMRTDIFGARVKARSKPSLWKLGYKLNNPQYEKFRLEVKERQDMPRQFPPAITHSRR